MVVPVPSVVETVPGGTRPFPVGALAVQWLRAAAPVLVVRVARAATGVRAPVLAEAAGGARERPGAVPVVPATAAATDAGLAGLPPLVGSEVATEGAGAAAVVVRPARVAAGVGVAVAGVVAGGGLVHRRDGATVAGERRGVAVAGATVPCPVRVPLTEAVVATEPLLPVGDGAEADVPGVPRVAGVATAEVDAAARAGPQGRTAPSA